MLSPEEIDRAGDAVAAVYTQIETEMLDYLVDRLLDGSVLDQKSTTALTLLAQTHTAKLREIIAKNQDLIDKAALNTVNEYLKASDIDDISRLGAGTPIWPKQVEASVSGISQVLSRSNLRMVEGAKQAFIDATVEAVTQVNTGYKTTEKALRSAVRNLERKGISVINYQNTSAGIRAVSSAVDVAVRRHIRTQIAQDGAKMTLERLNDMDVALVEVSSHEGARPTHAAWQGRCYSLHGTVKIDGVTYNDFYTATNYGAVDGLLGVNCRHSFGPYKHGTKRFYSPDPKHPSGLSNDEVYNLTQKQRYYERQIRAAKRELRGAQQIYDKQGGIEALTELSKAKEKLASRQSAMRTFIEESNAKCKKGTSVLTRHPNREWAGDMPKITTKRDITKLYSGKRTTFIKDLSNHRVNSLQTTNEIKSFLTKDYGIKAEESFLSMDIDIQKQVAAGLDDAAQIYGKPTEFKLIANRSRNNDGSYNNVTSTVKISTNTQNPYITAFHETIHAIDAEKSSKMAVPKRTTLENSYNIHSEKVLKEAKKNLGLKSRSKEYKDMVFEIMGYSKNIFATESSKHFEIVAYALDYKAQGKSNKLAEEVARLF